jgi:hypothetical protein
MDQFLQLSADPQWVSHVRLNQSATRPLDFRSRPTSWQSGIDEKGQYEKLAKTGSIAYNLK